MLVQFQSLSDTSRVWIFQSETELSDSQTIDITTALQYFLQDWTAHDIHLFTYGALLYHRFIVVIVDESKVSASGCSIDKLTHFIQSIEKKFSLNLLERMSVAFINEDESINVCHINDLSVLAKDGSIDADTIVFNNLVNTKIDFENKWKVKLTESWHKRFM